MSDDIVVSIPDVEINVEVPPGPVVEVGNQAPGVTVTTPDVSFSVQAPEQSILVTGRSGSVDVGVVLPKIDVGTYGTPGPAGPVGATGAPGPVGPQGVDSFYVHTQNVMSSVWMVQHNMGRHPSVHIQDAVGNVLYGSVVHLSPNELMITFTVSITGTAHCD